MNKLELNKLLKRKGKRYVLMLHCNRFITLTEKQVDYVLSYTNKDKEEKNANRRVTRTIKEKRKSSKSN